MTGHEPPISPEEEQRQAQSAMRTALVAELHMLELLLARGCLTDEGIEYGYRFCLNPNNVAPGGPAIVHERLLGRFIDAQVRVTGFPAEYWDRPLIDVPDDASGLDDGGDR